jgi:hypothetical protein
MTRIQTQISHVHPTASIHQRCTLLLLCYFGGLRASLAMLWRTRALVTRSEATVERWMGAAQTTRGSRMFRRLNGKPRPELDIDLHHGHPSPETRIWDRRSGQVVDGSGPMQDFAVGSLTLDAFFFTPSGTV